ncbi:uncharacterized protein L3040_000461 [Drepanopeziza brunnea f. sp. 'multigermtubi']|uniref:D-lactate dehydrogenase n=1 Tax=Marssonina brunnea f. sp. multigermtubi (strain MB_m1) TaxID=1072389 RepID=K1WHD4_MARBU|nr:D-lactate dehydrogenase [Drepanopeziza brunnea f. sp. 'multigermtubi' MB_m1]EKD17010.1 D-lactate dehydrogenase [Drepanopeziza brunnea f. sp. 'multigermtubi' MB_m1]KAJ5054179.1 hypothetical protein L3040_000461 [Drepanopeziza brunnea f. sp. 'multigermtubi']
MANPQVKLVALQTFLDDFPHITCVTPSSPNYTSLRHIFASDKEAIPLAIVRPKSAADVSLLIKFAVSNSIRITVRTGGHNLSGLCFAQDALTIDMRDIAYVDIAADKETVRIGGGIIQLDLALALDKEGLATPMGTCVTVGHVGWATYGGYGPFSSHWGLGVDQIVGAKIVNASGNVVEADERLLRGLRGGGGLFGVVVELTIKVYRIRTVLTGALLLESQNLATTFKEFSVGYQDLSDKGLPSELLLQPCVMSLPQGRVIVINFMWSSEDMVAGRRWLAKVEALVPIAINTVTVTTIPDLMNASVSGAPESAYGVTCTHSLKKITSEVAAVIGDNFSGMGDDCLFTLHELRGVSASANKDSVFATREPHFMLEILGYSTTAENRDASAAWAEKTWREVGQTDPSNVLPGTYISLDHSASKPVSMPFSRHYGPYHEELRALKREFDPEDVFALAVPILSNYT